MAGLFFDERSEQHFKDLVLALQTKPLAVLIGAGLSAPALPTWKDLHRHLRDASGLGPRYRFRAECAPMDFSTFKEEMVEEKFLGAIKEVRCRGLTCCAVSRPS